jgi:hypothetical protein
VPKLAEGTSSTVEPGYPTPTGSKGESTEVPEIIGQEKIESARVLKHSAEATEKMTEVLELGESARLQKILSPPPEPKLPKVPRAPAITSNRRRMASVLDIVLESTRASTPAPVKETAEAAAAHAEVEAGPSMPIETECVGTGQSIEQGPSDVGLDLEKKACPIKLNLLLPKCLLKSLTLLFDTLRVKGCPKRKLQKPDTMPGN